MTGLISIAYQCPHCGEGNEALVDPTGGSEQSYTEDCAVCCNPILLTISISIEGDVTLSVDTDK
jgi:hypothetical protein